METVTVLSLVPRSDTTFALDIAGQPQAVPPSIGPARGTAGVVLCALLAAAAGCVSTDPRPDYDRAAHSIQERLGIAEVYAPGDDDAVGRRVDELLADGLTVDEAVQLALLNNPDFQALFTGIGASRADVAQSALLSNPTLALALQLPESGGLTDLTFSFAQQVADLWQIPVRKKIAEADLEQTILAVGQRAVDLAAEVRAHCYEVLALRRAVEFSRQNVQLAERIAALSRAQFEAGEVSEFDHNLATSTVVTTQQEQLNLSGQQRRAEIELAHLLGLSLYPTPWELNDTLPGSWSPPPDELGLVDRALDARFDARMAFYGVQRAEETLRLEQRRWLSDLQLGLAFERPEQRALPGRDVLADTARASIAAGQLTAPTIESRGQRDMLRRQMIDTKLGPSLAMTVPLWDQNQAQVAKAAIRVLQARKGYEGTLESIAADVQRSCAGASTAAQELRFLEQTALPQAESLVSGAQRRYEAGEESVLVVVEAQDVLIERRRALVTALRNYAVSMARLESAVGGPVELARAVDVPRPEIAR